MDPGHLLTFRHYGYRMIGAAEARAEYVRRRYLGASLNLGPQYVGPGSVLVGEGSAPAPAPHRLTLHLGPSAPPPLPVHAPLSLHLARFAAPAAPIVPAAVVAVAAPTSDAAAAPLGPYDVPGTPAACPTCPTIPVGAAAAGVAGGALLMYFVGLATREAKKKRR